MKDTVLPSVIIQPVGLDPKNPTRYDFYVEGVQGAACGYTKCPVEALAWKDGIERAIKYSFNLGKANGKHS